ncbi:hypothetical protein VTK73DRAFT_6805 [Phialemonium thermophilum]|uniref:Transcription factor Rba50 n=1 Tax=Phialemonium thermophilum TaxID=223376 RepID=A0ABR3Y762_9PEZI
MDPSGLLVLDVKEKEVDHVAPPTLPSEANTTGFPEHKKRSRVSAFKQRRSAVNGGDAGKQDNGKEPQLERAVVSSRRDGPSEKSTQPKPQVEKERIDEENKARIASMSREEIEEARQELLNELDPSLLQMLMRRANIDDTRASSVFQEDSREQKSNAPMGPSVEDHDEDESAKDQPKRSSPVSKAAPKKVTFDEDAAPPEPPSGLFPLASQQNSSDASFKHHRENGTTHFPAPPQVPDLDPSDPDFLAKLHSKFFPNLPADPSKLAWMAPIPTPDSAADQESPYYPAQSSLPVSALRFDFRGALLPPRLSRVVPTSKGLHHHGEAPEAAGYTILELARLARSAVPGQRCIAFQTLGRILYRLGKGEFGVGEGGRVGDEDDLAFALWRLIRQGQIIETLEQAAGVEEGVGHRGVRAYAIEALWLLEKGGWKEKWRGM